MARRPNQVSMPNPEFGVDFDASARAMHQSASKGSLMVHETAFSMPAVARKSLAATMFERNTMLKTLKRKIALVAVATLGAGGLSIVAAPVASAATGASQAGTVTPVRVSFTGTTRDAVPAATFSFTNNSGAQLTDGTGTGDAALVLSQAPSSTAEVTVTLPGTGTVVDTLGGAGTPLNNSDNVLDANYADAAAMTASIAITANAAAGTYKGTLTLNDGTDDITVTFSFTTAGAPSTIALDKTAVSLPAIAHAGGNFVASQTVVVSLKDASGNGTQIGTGDTLTASLVDNANIGMVNNAQAATLTITDANLADNSHSLVIGSKTITADSETITITPNGVLPGLGVVAKTFTATTVAYGATTSAVTTVTAPSSSAVILKNASTAQTDYSVDPGTASIVAETSGLEAGKAYRIGVLVTKNSVGGTTVAGTYSVAGATAAAWTNGADAYSYGIADSTGKVTTVIAFTVLMQALDTVQINVTTDDADYTDTSDLKVAAATSAYTTTLTAPATTPSVAITGATTPVAGTIADQYGNPFVGATVTVVGAQTLSSGTAANLTAQAVTDAAGKFSVTLGAANALTTSIALTVDAARGGVSATQKTATVNFNAGGAATAMTFLVIGDEDSATTPTFYPNIVVPFNDGVVSGVTDEVWEVATGAASGNGAGLGGDGSVAMDATDECVALDIETTPLAQVTATGSAGVLFSDTVCAAQKLSDLKNTVTVASKTNGGGLDTLWVTSTKTGKNTVTLTSGGVSKTVTFYAQNWLTAAAKGIAARDIVLDSSAKTLTGGEIGFITATVVDTFGNIVEQAAGVSTVKAAITGAALLDGPSLSKSGLLGDASGQVTLGIIAGNAAGTATLTVTGVNGTGGQNGALVGTATSTTTAGTNAAFKASANVKTATITVTAASSTAVDAVKTDVTAVKADVKAVSDTVATLSKAVTTIQSSVTELTSSFSAQIKSLSAAIAKISKAIAALSKKIK